MSRETYEESLAIMESRRFENHRDKSSAQNPFRNIFVCGHCGTVMICSKAGTKNGKPYARIYCDSIRFNKEAGCESYEVWMDETIEKVRVLLEEEVSKAASAAHSLPSIVASAWYQGELSLLREQRDSLTDKILDHSLTVEERDGLYRELLHQP